MSKAKINIVVNAPAALGADLTRPGQGRVLVTGDSKGFLRPKVKSIALKPFIVETLADIDITATAAPAVGTAYKFVIEQEAADSQQNKQPKRFFITVVATSTVAAAFGAQVTAAVQGLIDSGELRATATVITSGNGGVTIGGVAGAPLVKVIQPVNMTVASGLPAGTSSGNLSASGTTLTLLQNPTAAFEVGQLVRLTGWTGTAVINGKTAAQGAILRVSAVTTNTNVQFVAQSVSGSISAATADYEILATEAEGLGEDLIAERGIVGPYLNAAIVAATVYHEVVVDYLEPTGETMTKEEGAPIQKSYFIDATTDLDNADDLLEQFGYVKDYLDVSGTNADPLLIG